MPLKQRNFVRQAFEMPDTPMDAIDRRIVAELQAAPRLRVAELARRIGLSGPAVADRLRRLEENGTLTYRAEVDPRALGYTLFAIVRISPVGGRLRLIPRIAARLPRSCTRPRSRRGLSPCPEVGDDLPDGAPAERGHAGVGLAAGSH